MFPEEMKTDAPELAALTREERRFWRLIEEREKGEDGIERLRLACGHTELRLEAFPEWRTYAHCPECEGRAPGAGLRG